MEAHMVMLTYGLLSYDMFRVAHYTMDMALNYRMDMV
jgi:hypothetical protein